MPVYQLGNGNDYFNSRNQTDWAGNSAVFGGNGNDTIITNTLPYAPADNVFVDGGNGDDSIVLGTSHSVAFGGNGDDTLIAEGGGSGMQPGTTLTGGLGHDTFMLESGTGNLVVTNDAAGSGVVSDGDTFKGPMDVITDLQPGEHIGLRQYDIRTNGPTVTDLPVARVDTVTLAPDPLAHVGDSFRPVLGASQYAVFHGTFAGGNTFTIGADGPDLLAVYDTHTSAAEQVGSVGKGSLVLTGVTDEQLLDQALSPLTAQGPGGGWHFPGQDVSGFASLGQPATPASATDLIDGGNKQF